jgi:hypothetical protein
MKKNTKYLWFSTYALRMGIFLFSINLIYAEHEFEKITLISGEQLEKIKILEVSHTKVRLRHSEGIISISPTNLPDEIREKLGVSEKVIAKKLAEDQIEVKNSNEFLKFQDKALVLISGEVLQIFDDGTLLISKARFKKAKEVPHNEKWVMEDTIILHLDANHGLVSGDSLRPHSNWALHTGEVTYKTVLGSARTVRKYEMRQDVVLKAGLNLTKLDSDTFKKLASDALQIEQK